MYGSCKWPRIKWTLNPLSCVEIENFIGSGEVKEEKSGKGDGGESYKNPNT